MTNVEQHEPGTPVWVDVTVEQAEQRERLADFYSSLFSWTWDVGPEQLGYYSIARLDGRAVMGLSQVPGGRGAFTTYFCTDDIAKSAARAGELGANVFMGPMQVTDIGSMALVSDPVGAAHGLWQAGSFSGFEVAYEPGSLGWFDHVSGDPERAAAYYRDLTGHTLMESEGETRILVAGERWFASVSHDQLAHRVPQWNPIFVVASLGEIREQVRSLGATVVLEEMPVPGSAISVFVEPVMHATVTVMQAGQEESVDS